MRWLVVSVIVLMGCNEEPVSASKPTTRVAKEVSKPIAKPAKPTDTPAKAAARRERFEVREAAHIPPELPPAWRTLISATRARPTDVRVEWRSGPKPSLRRLHLTLNLWGKDAEVDARLLTALTAAGLPSDTLPTAAVTVKNEEWRVNIDRFMAPEGVPRETQATITWRRTVPLAKGAKKCRNPKPVAAPRGLPSWLVQLTKRRSTRQRIAAGVDSDKKGTWRTQRVLFHNGFVHDEFIGKITKAVKSRGFHLAMGHGTRQTWSLPNGAQVEWLPDPDDLELGCILGGPVLVLRWKSPTP